MRTIRFTPQKLCDLLEPGVSEVLERKPWPQTYGNAALTHGNGREVEDVQMWLATSRLRLSWRGESVVLPRIL
jgi:hypothetical protein